MVRSASAMIGPVLRRGNLVILESTSPAGTTCEVMCPVLEELSGLKAGVDFHACYCPERVMPGRTIEELEQNDRVVGGVTPECARRAVALYHTFVKGGVHATTAATAEMCKLMENSYRDVNVAFANEIARLCEAEGVDAYEAIRLSNLHPRVNILKPGPGVGGHCIPVDPWFMVERQPGVARLITTSRRTNDATPVYLARAMEARFGLAAGARVAVLGVAYRANIDDARETPASAFVATLVERGFDVRCWDPLVHGFTHPLAASLADAIEGADAVALLVGHNEIVASLDPTWWGTVVAGRRVFDAADLIPDSAVWEAQGFDIAGVGRMGHVAEAWEAACAAVEQPTTATSGGHATGGH
jgi:UDP-N-acetyl-D-mannosaminuronic acid dehydrogenase